MHVEVQHTYINYELDDCKQPNHRYLLELDWRVNVSAFAIATGRIAVKLFIDSDNPTETKEGTK
jgi:hypothetical protein